MLPAVVQQRYREAKAAFQQHRQAEAAQGFAQVLLLLEDEDLTAVLEPSALADLSTLAAGFRELSLVTTPPP